MAARDGHQFILTSGTLRAGFGEVRGDDHRTAHSGAAGVGPGSKVAQKLSCGPDHVAHLIALDAGEAAE